MKLWEIREEREDQRFSYPSKKKDKRYDEDDYIRNRGRRYEDEEDEEYCDEYEEGYKAGYRAAMKKYSHKYEDRY